MRPSKEEVIFSLQEGNKCKGSQFFSTLSARVRHFVTTWYDHEIAWLMVLLKLFSKIQSNVCCMSSQNWEWNQYLNALRSLLFSSWIILFFGWLPVCLFLLCLCSCPFSWGFFQCWINPGMQQLSSSTISSVEVFSLVLNFFSTASFPHFSEKSGRSNFRLSVQEELSEKCLWV